MLGRVLATVVVLSLVLIIFGCSPGIQWNTRSSGEYNKIVRMFGKASSVNTGPSGMAIWDSFDKQYPFTRIVIEDVMGDNVYITVKYIMDAKKTSEVLSVSSNLLYDEFKNELTAKTSSLGESMNLLVVSDKVHNDLINTVEAEKMIGINYTESDKNNYRSLQSLKDMYEYTGN